MFWNQQWKVSNPKTKSTQHLSATTYPTKNNITYLVTNISTPKSFPKKKQTNKNQIKQPGVLFLHIFPTHFFPSNPNQLGFPSLGSPCPPHMRSNSVTHQLKGLGSTWIHGLISERASLGRAHGKLFQWRRVFCRISLVGGWTIHLKNMPKSKWVKIFPKCSGWK